MTILFLHILPVLAFYISFQFSGNPLDCWAPTTFLVFVGLYCVVFWPLSYSVTPGYFTIHRIVFDIIIPLSMIRTAIRIAQDGIKLPGGMVGFGGFHRALVSIPVQTQTDGNYMLYAGIRTF